MYEFDSRIYKSHKIKSGSSIKYVDRERVGIFPSPRKSTRRGASRSKISKKIVPYILFIDDPKSKFQNFSIYNAKF